MARTRLLFKLGFLYHKAAFDPVIEFFLDDPDYDVYFSLDEEKVRRFFFFTVPHRPRLLDDLVRSGYRFTREKAGYDVVVAGDPLTDVLAYGEPIRCFLNHGTGIKSILYRNLGHNRDIRYEIFVEGRYRVEKIHASGTLGQSRIHLIGLPKLDWVFQGRYDDRAGLLRRWGLDPDRPTVLFAPTYKPTCLYEVKDAIFEAYRGRRVYGTTNARIRLVFSGNGHLMGSAVPNASRKEFLIDAAGENALKKVDVFRNGDHYQRLVPKGKAFQDELKVDDDEPSFWYVSVTQVDNQIAWSSPIWFE